MARLAISELPEPYVPAYQEIETTCTMTHDGRKLGPKEDRFISLYIQYADASKAAKEAGYSIRPTVKNKEAQWEKRGRELLSKDYIKNEIAYRMEEIRSAQIADAKDVLMYLTRVMRGEEKDQFDLPVSISDRTAAAKELNRRFKEMEDATDRAGVREVRLVLRRD